MSHLDEQSRLEEGAKLSPKQYSLLSIALGVATFAAVILAAAVSNPIQPAPLRDYPLIDNPLTDRLLVGVMAISGVLTMFGMLNLTNRLAPPLALVLAAFVCWGTLLWLGIAIGPRFSDPSGGTAIADPFPWSVFALVWAVVCAIILPIFWGIHHRQKSALSAPLPFDLPRPPVLGSRR